MLDVPHGRDSGRLMRTTNRTAALHARSGCSDQRAARLSRPPGCCIEVELNHVGARGGLVDVFLDVTGTNMRERQTGSRSACCTPFVRKPSAVRLRLTWRVTDWKPAFDQPRFGLQHRRELGNALFAHAARDRGHRQRGKAMPLDVQSVPIERTPRASASRERRTRDLRFFPVRAGSSGQAVFGQAGSVAITISRRPRRQADSMAGCPCPRGVCAGRSPAGKS